MISEKRKKKKVHGSRALHKKRPHTHKEPREYEEE